MQEAIALARAGMERNDGGPFGAVVVKNGVVIARGNNRVTTSNDPSAHAEVVAIREACLVLGSYQLTGCTIYTSCEPCPMCLGAIYWARPDRVVYAGTREDAANAGFDDAFIYHEINLPIADRSLPFAQIAREEAQQVFQEWEDKSDKIAY